MQKQHLKQIVISLSLTTISGLAYGEDFHIQSGGRAVKVVTPGGRSANSVLPPKQGLWFIEEDDTQESSGKTPPAVRTVDGVDVEANKTRMSPLSRERYTVGEARARLKKAKAQLEKDKDILAKYAEEADPNKLELWRARITTQEQLIVEKEMALRRIEDRYIRRLRQQRDARLYESQSSYYEKIGAGSSDLSFK